MPRYTRPLLKWNRNTLPLVHNSHCQIPGTHSNRHLFIRSLPEGGFTFAYQTPVSRSEGLGLFVRAVLKKSFHSEIYPKRTKKLRLSNWAMDRHIACKTLKYSNLCTFLLLLLYSEKKNKRKIQLAQWGHAPEASSAECRMEAKSTYALRSADPGSSRMLTNLCCLIACRYVVLGRR